MAVIAIIFLFVVGFAYFLVWWAHEAKKDRSAMVGLYLLLGAPGFLLFIAGLAVTTRRGAGGLGPTLLLGGLGLMLPLFRPVRVQMARIGDFDPDDPVHMLGSGIFLGAIGFLGGQLISAPAPDQVSSFDVGPIVIQGIFFVALAVVSVGYHVDRTWPQVRDRLGLVRPTLAGTGAALGAVVVAFIISGIASELTRATNEKYANEINRSLEVMTTSSPSYIAAPLIGLSAGIGEELLFRGALQPRYGIIPTSILFALLHSQYGFSFITLGTFLLGCLFGILAKRYGTTHAIIAHALYNTVAVLISALAR
ncbi:MAG TPA: CPBP family intramembrane glutamic endopeptidase [Thermomicrobiales bacterium]|nr:CPBP family intramembrane glutamic endopeptidase [Thermomicrobiales bacterium]